MPNCPSSPDGEHWTNFPPDGRCRFCKQAFGFALATLLHRILRRP